MKRLLTCCAALALLALPVAAEDAVIYSGVDLWYTHANELTWTDFSKDPIPPGFFCSGSPAFTGKVSYQGDPVATSPEGALGRTDTIVHRLDDAVFNDQGMATTRIQMRAMAFSTVEPIKTQCGAFDIRVSLVGEQPITEMEIVRVGKEGGYFLAPISVNVRLAFTRTDGSKHEPLELYRELRFPANPDNRWLSEPGAQGLTRKGFVQVDTNDDGTPDTYLPGTSNFAAGWQEVVAPNGKLMRITNPNCHIQDSCGHCPGGDVFALELEAQFH